MMSVSANPTMMSMSTIPLLSEGEPVGATYFKDTGDDLDKLRIAAIYNYGYLKIELDVDSLPSDSSYLVLRGAFGGFAHLAFNGNNMGYVGSGLNNLYYAFELPNDYVKQGNNTIEFFVYGMAWAKVDSVSIVVDGGNKTNGQIKNIRFEDWSMTYNSKIDTYFADIYANSTTQNINTTAGLQLVNSIGLYGQNHFSSSDYATLDLSEDKYRFRVTLPDNVEKDGSSPNETGNWNLFSIIIQNKRALTVESKGFYYTDSKGLRNFGLNFKQDCSRYTNGSITIKATVDDLFKRPFSHLILPDGSKVYDYEADYTVSENGAYTFKVAEPDGTVTSFVHKVTNIDKTAPQIAILSDPTIITLETNIYVDPGVSVSDNLSGFDSMEPEIDYNGLNIADTQPGAYTIKYTIFDRAGNSNSTSRIVIVKNKPLKVMTGDIFKDPSNVSINGNLAYFGEEEITEKGLVWGIISNPTIDNNEGKQSWTTDILNKNNFSKTIAINSLIENAAYNVRAYAKTATGRIVYGQNKTFEANNKSYGSFQLTNTNIRIEKGNSIKFDIARTGGSDGEVQVYYRTINGSAVEGIHFNNNFGFVTFADGDSTTKSVTVSTLNYSTWEKANRQFYFEIYQLEGKGNIGSSNFASVTFTNDTDDISNIKNGSWDSIWSTYDDYTSDSNKTMYTPEVSLAQYAYWREQASSFLGRGYGTIETYLVDVRFQLLKLTTSWVDAGYSYFASIDGFKYTRDNGVNVKDASKLKLKIDVEHAGGFTDHGGVKDPGVQIYIKDISVPRIEYFYSINGDYAEGDTVYVSTVFNEIVTSSNITDVRMNIKLYDIDGNEAIQKANYITGINTDTLVFRFVVPAGKYNSKLEFAETNFDNYGNINDLAGNAFTGVVPSTVINASAHIASTCHNIVFLPNGNSTPALNHSTSVTVTKSLSDPAKITTTEYLWATDRNTKIKGFKSFNNGETLDIGGATGSFYLHIRSRDDYGNETYVISNPFILNNAEPTFSLIPDTLEWTKNDVKITVSDIPTDAIISSYQYKTGFYTVENFGSGTDFTGSGSFLVSTNDLYSVCLTTNMGKKYVNTIKISNVDKILPVVEIDTETNGSDGKTVYLASTKATGVDEGGSQLSTLQYVWTNSSTKPKEGWMDFSSGERLEKIASGIWYLHIQAVDNAGNESYTCSNPFILDNIGPEINVTGSDFIDWTNQEIILTVSASKNNLDYVMMPDLTTVSATNGIVNTTFTADKNGYYKFIAVDEAGNTAEAGINITKIDADAPKILVSKSTEDWTAGNIALTISSEDNASPIYNNNGDVIEYGGIGGIMIRKQGSAFFEEYTGPFVFDVTENGLYQITAKDALGNQTTRDIRITNIDKTPPFVDADNTDYGAKDSSIAVTLIYSDAEMGVVRRKEYKVTSSTGTPTIYDFYDGRPIVLNREGTYYIHYRAVDEVNNTVTGYFGPYVINSAVPSITLQSSDAMTYKKSHSVQVIVDFNGFTEGEINYQWTENSQIPSTNWESAIENNGTISRDIVNGDYYLHVRVSANGSYYYASKLFKFDNTAPVVILNGDNPTSLPYRASYVEKGVKYSDNYDLWPRYTAADLSIIKSNVLRTYTLDYLVTDSAGNDTNLRRTVNVIDVTPPVATTVDLNVNEDNILSLTKEDFILSYSDDVTSLSKIKILSLPANGQLNLAVARLRKTR